MTKTYKTSSYYNGIVRVTFSDGSVVKHRGLSPRTYNGLVLAADQTAYYQANIAKFPRVGIRTV